MLLTFQVISVAFYSEHEKSEKFCSEALILTWGSLTCHKSTTWDPRLYFPSEGSHTQVFTLSKNPLTPTGYEPANLGSRGEYDNHGTTGVDHTFKIPPDTQFCGQTNLFYGDFGRLTGTEPMFWSVRVAVIDPLYIACDNSPDKSIIHGITDKLTTDIYSLLNLLRCQFKRYRSTASVFQNVLIWRGMVSLDALSFFFADIIPKLCIHSQYPII